MDGDATRPQTAKRKRDSAATGGAATGGGVEYQTDYAVYLALDLFIRLLGTNPAESPVLVIEPRLLGSTTVTRWDIQVTPGERAFEAKRNASNDDVDEWIDRSLTAFRQNPEIHFELVFGARTSVNLRGLERIVTITKASKDEADFRKICELENEIALKMLSRLGETPLEFARRLNLKNLSPEVLEEEIDFRLRCLVQADQTRRVRDWLTTEFLKAMKNRQRFSIRDLLEQLKSDGVVFRPHHVVVPSDIDPTLHTAIFVLQRCASGLPGAVLQAVCPGSRDEILPMLKSADDAIFAIDGLWRCRPLPATMDHPRAGEITGAALDAIIEFIKENRGSIVANRQVDNAIELARLCQFENPRAAALAFDPLDKLLKRRGRKREVLDVAQISVEAARKVKNRTEEIAQAEAKALICGFSWVYQRIGQLDKAESYANESLELGLEIDWPRNSAYCKKCMGRLKRAQAEAALTDAERPKLLQSSVELLKEAIELFTRCDELKDRRFEEIGDCHSLLGRTFLAGRRVALAESSAAAARPLVDKRSKDYMDLLILEGEIAASKDEFRIADERFSEAISLLEPDDAERSEIAARALLCKGRCLHRSNKGVKAAAREIERAIEIWESLGEYYSVSTAKWAMLEVEGKLPKSVVARLKMLSPPIRVEAASLYRNLTAPRSRRTLSQRSDLSDSAWQSIIAEAKRNDAIRFRHW